MPLRGKAGFWALVSASAALAQEPPSAHSVYEKVRESIVAVRALAPLGERSGTGIVLSPDGLILTSTAVCPEGSVSIRVWTAGPRLYEAEFVAAAPAQEIALLRVRALEKLAPAALGRSAEVRIGDPVYTLGNAANSIILDNQPSFHAGLISGVYRLAEPRAGASYVGRVFETTAAMNFGMEGAPCLDAAGRVVGLMTPNYSPNRFLGAAIPIDEIRPALERLLARPAAAAEEPAPEGGEADLGLRARDQDGKVVVAEVRPDGPAARAGLAPGDVLLEVAGAPLRSARELGERLKGLEPGAIVWIRAEVSGRQEQVRVTLEAKK
ncbi:MAG: S1C family serine protease [Planctomycetota bacterium]